MKQDKLQIEVLGKLQIHRDGVQFFEDTKIKNNKPLQLLVYILCQPGRSVARDNLITSGLVDDSNDNPRAVYKNIVYRLRKLLKSENLISDEDEAIQYSENIYRLDLDIETDFDLLAKHLDRITHTSNHEDIWKLCLAATKLYRNEFLEGVITDEWALAQSQQYKKLYLEVVDIMWYHLQRNCRYEEALPAFERAFEIYQLEERLYLRYIELLFKVGDDRKALKIYESVCAGLFDELGEPAPKTLIKLMSHNYKGSNAVALHINDVIDSLNGNASGSNGAFERTLYEFSSIHERFTRGMKRSGKEVFLMLITLWEEDGSLPVAGIRRKTLMGNLQKTLVSTLRSEDVFARYSSSQYIVMLTDLNSDHCDMISSRLKSNFSSARGMKKLRMDIKYILAPEMKQTIEKPNDIELSSQNDSAAD